jgi:hypothetical protein
MKSARKMVGTGTLPGQHTLSHLMTSLPLVRNAMLLISVVLAAIVGYQVSRPHRPMAMRVAGTLSIILTLGIAGWVLLHPGP